MGPRKRSKPKQKGEAIQDKDKERLPETLQKPEQAQRNGSIGTQEGDGGDPNTASASNTKAGGASSAPRSTKSWYGSSWPKSSKATPVTEVARESISAASNALATSVSSAKSIRKEKQANARSPSLSLSQSGTSSRSLPCATTTTKLNVTSDPPEHISSSTSKLPAQSTSSLSTKSAKHTVDQPSQQLQDESEDQISKQLAPLESNVNKDDTSHVDLEPKIPLVQPEVVEGNRQSMSWRDWLFKSGYGGNNNSYRVGTEEQSPQNPETTEVEASNKSTKPIATLIANEGDPLNADNTSSAKDANKQESASGLAEGHPPATAEPPMTTRSWFNFFSANPQPTPEPAAANAELEVGQQPAKSPGDIRNNEADSKSKDEDPVSSSDISQVAIQTTPARSSGWAFWSKGRSSNTSDSNSTDVGEVAVANSPSQSQPETASINQAKAPIPSEPKKPNNKRERPESMEIPEERPSRSLRGPKFGPPDKPESSQSPGPRANQVDITAPKDTRKIPPNLLLPNFKGTYPAAQNISVLQHISRLLLPGHDSGHRHLSIVRDPPKIKSALAIGVHGYFPAPLIRTVLGQPTGTSIRFANGAATAIQRWVSERGYSCEIEKIALEGEGKIADRIDTLWKLMLNWLDHIRKADFILVACHSQGVPVALMLVAKLIAMGCVSSARIGVCAMAGVNLGPFQDYKSRFLSGSAGELFDFANPNSAVSKKYEEALILVLRHGVRVVYIGSIDDQLVSLESSTFSNISHPYIYRAVFVDGRIHAPDFITHLVGFALKLRNLGISDHGLIRELSSPLAGSLYSGEGHSRVYDDQAVYDLAVEHALETTSIGDAAPSIQKYEPPTSANPYYLPWALRGLLEEDVVRRELRGETAQLLQQFESWKPSSKVLKDVKFRLEAVRSKL